MRRKTLLYAISFFASIIGVLLLLNIPDRFEVCVETFKEYQRISRISGYSQKMKNDYLSIFIFSLSAFIVSILQSGFFMSVGLWSHYEYKALKEKATLSDEEKQSIIPSKRDTIIVLLICAGIILVPIMYMSLT